MAVHDRLRLIHQEEMVKSWMVRDRVPQEHWRQFADLGLCTLDELATAAALKAAKGKAA